MGSCIASTVLIGTSQISVTAAIAAPAGPVPAPVPDSAVAAGAVGADGLRGRSSPAGITKSARVCYFETRGDDVHVSSSAHEASGHGWWVNIDCDVTKAVVTVQLQEYYSDGTWRNVGAVGRSTVKSGGGAGNRATGRGHCRSGSLTGWRSVIDVDLVGVPDDPNKLVTTGRNIRCRR
ncbi:MULTISPECIES: hypothetical protein [Frankia]|uniref:hypothetical protein n=1 Tax=Frankia TaxID=1854 RepID=UPI0009F50064|nr:MULTISPECIES: hypothetical protein [Frankia]